MVDGAASRFVYAFLHEKTGRTANRREFVTRGRALSDRARHVGNAEIDRLHHYRRHERSTSTKSRRLSIRDLSRLNFERDCSLENVPRGSAPRRNSPTGFGARAPVEHLVELEPSRGVLAVGEQDDRLVIRTRAMQRRVLLIANRDEDGFVQRRRADCREIRERVRGAGMIGPPMGYSTDACSLNVIASTSESGGSRPMSAAAARPARSSSPPCML